MDLVDKFLPIALMQPDAAFLHLHPAVGVNSGDLCSVLYSLKRRALGRVSHSYTF